MLLIRSFNFQFNFTEGCYLCKTAIQIHMTNTINKAFHDFQILDVIKIWHRDRKRIIIGTVIGMITSIVVALVLPTYYESNKYININASLYDIREHYQGRNDKGKMNNKSLDEKYNELISTLRVRLKVLAKKIEPKVYEYEFLKA